MLFSDSISYLQIVRLKFMEWSLLETGLLEQRNDVHWSALYM
jgi:hypothetical protein